MKGETDDVNHFGWNVLRHFSADVHNGNNTVVISATESTPSDNLEKSASFLHPPQCLVHGVIYPASCSEKKWVAMNSEVRYRHDDILLVSYPKCGTTWIEQCVLLILRHGDKSVLNPATKNVYSPAAPEKGGKIWLEACIDQDIQLLKSGEEFRSISWKEFDEAPSPRVIKSHAPSKLLLGMDHDSDLSDGAKIIIISRNPLDACVSRFHHAFNPCKSGWSFPAWAAVWISGNSTYGCWYDWVRDWSLRAKMNKDKILWLQYEDMKANPHAQIKRIVDFLDVSEGQDIPALIERVAEGCSFNSMKKQASEKEISGDFGGHLRKGVVGDWKNYFTEAMTKEFLDKYKRELAGTGLVYDFGSDIL